MFLKPTANPTPRRTPSPRVVLRRRQRRMVARRLFRLRNRDVGFAADHLGDRQRAGDDLAGREYVSRAERVSRAQLDTAEGERVGELVHLGLVREAGLDGNRPRMAPQGGLFVQTQVASSKRSAQYGPQPKEAALDVTAVELEA